MKSSRSNTWSRKGKNVLVRKELKGEQLRHFTTYTTLCDVLKPSIFTSNTFHLGPYKFVVNKHTHKRHTDKHSKAILFCTASNYLLSVNCKKKTRKKIRGFFYTWHNIRCHDRLVNFMIRSQTIKSKKLLYEYYL